MPKVEDYIAYFNELAKKAGFTDEQAKPILEALKNDTIREGFVPRPNYSHDLDEANAKARTAAIEEARTFYGNWVNTDVLPKYQTQIDAATKKLTRYQELYGDLEGSGDITPNPRKATLSRYGIKARFWGSR